MNTTTADLFAELNYLRVAQGKRPLKAWKDSRAVLERALEMMRNADPAPLGVTVEPTPDDPVAEFIAKNGVTKCPPPKALVDEAKRRERVERIAAKLNAKNIDESIREAKVTASTPKAKATLASLEGVTLVSIARELGINDKIARAKMRRVSVPADFLVAKHTYHPQHKQWVIDVLRRDMRKEPRKA
jgi:hypothetical protein